MAEHAPPAFDAFVRLQEEGGSYDEACQRCLAEQGQEFLDACDFVMTHGALVTHDYLVEFAGLSQKGFARDPKELLVLAKWPISSPRFWCRVSGCAEQGDGEAKQKLTPLIKRSPSLRYSIPNPSV